jgi:sugar phosphate isomerase/epimerase
MRHSIYSLLLYAVIFSGCLGSKNLHKKTTFNPEIGVCTSMSNALTLSGQGYQYIEESVGNLLMPLKSDEEFAVNLEKTKQLPVPLVACNGFLPGNLKSVGPAAVHDQILQFAEVAFRRAKQTGVRIIVFGSGGSRSIPSGFSKDSAFIQFINLCKKLGPVAAKYQVTLVIEPLNTTEVNFINSLAEGAKVVNETNHPNIKLLADIYHMLKENEAPEEIIKYRKMIVHAHVAEKNGRAVPGTHNEDLSPYYAAFKKIGYKGMISIEGRWENMEQQGKRALEVMRSQF